MSLYALFFGDDRKGLQRDRLGVSRCESLLVQLLSLPPRLSLGLRQRNTIATAMASATIATTIAAGNATATAPAALDLLPY